MISKESKQKKRMQGSQIKATVIQEVTSYGILSPVSARNQTENRR